jgi:hypothetical protein
MLHWLRKRRKSTLKSNNLGDIVHLPNDRFSEFMKHLFEGELPATHAMVVVAYANLLPMIAVFKQVSEERGEQFSLEAVVTVTLQRLDKASSGMNKRRLFWFSLASLLYILAQRAGEDDELRSATAEIWLMLARSGLHLKPLLQHNVIWKESEKACSPNLKTRQMAFAT